MRKKQKISDLESTIAFSEFDFYKSYEQSFYSSELGHLYRATPFTSPARLLDLTDIKKGRDSYFSAKGKLALTFLKLYTRFSDSV